MRYTYMCDQPRLRSYAQSDQSLCYSLEYSMTVKLQTEHHLEFLILKGACTCQNATLLEITCRGSYILNSKVSRWNKLPIEVQVMDLIIYAPYHTCPKYFDRRVCSTSQSQTSLLLRAD